MIKLNDRAWVYFTIGDLFSIKTGKALLKKDLELGKVPYITSTSKNNGVTALIRTDPIFNGGVLTVNWDGSVGCSFYQENPFFASDRVNVLTPKFKINKYIGLFFKTIIELEKFKFGYGRKWNKNRMTNSKIKIPVTNSGDPDWQFMEDYIKQFEETKLLEIQETDYKDNVKLPSVDEWGSFRLDELFKISRGRLAKKPSDIGEVPYISSSGMNNGLNESFDINSKYIVRADLSPVITVANNGSVGSTFVQEFSFAASSDVSVLEPIFNSNADALLFIKVVIERSKNLYGYGRKWGLEKMRSSIIKLPALENGEPDWELMERYIKSLPYSEMI